MFGEKWLKTFTGEVCEAKSKIVTAGVMVEAVLMKLGCRTCGNMGRKIGSANKCVL